MAGISVIVVAAGKGIRLKSRVPKPLVRVGTKPLVMHCLLAFQRHAEVSEIILVTGKDLVLHMQRLVRRYRVNKVRCVVAGGERRQDSVCNGLGHVSTGIELVAVHDAARPLVSKAVLDRVFSAASRHKAAIAAVPVKATIKKVRQGKVIVSLDRGDLWEIQTPQVFRRRILQEAYRRFGRSPVTDDAMLVEKLGIPVRVVEGSYRNLKVTTPEDIGVAAALLRTKE